MAKPSLDRIANQKPNPMWYIASSVALSAVVWSEIYYYNRVLSTPAILATSGHCALGYSV